MIVVDELLGVVSPDQPSGPNLEYEKSFADLDRLVRGKPEQQIGDHVVAAEGPDWREAEKVAATLLRTTHDLRIATHLTRALLHTGAFPGFAQGLLVVRGLVERFWDSVHPQLDPDDDNDPTLRVNVITELVDPDTVLAWVRTTPLVKARGLGNFSLRDVALTTGELKPRAGEPPPAEASVIEAAFGAAPIDELTATLEALRAAQTAVRETETIVGEKVGDESALRLTRLRELLAQAIKVVEPHQARRAPAGAAAGGAATGDGGQVGGAGGAAAPAAGLAGEVQSREDVVRALDKIVQYYERHEPSSPIPIFVKRCRRLVNKSFLEIVRDLAPDGVGQIEVLRGPLEEGSGE